MKFYNLQNDTLRNAYDFVHYNLKRAGIEYIPNDNNFQGILEGFQICYTCKNSTKTRCNNIIFKCYSI